MVYLQIMFRLIDDISSFLEDNGFECSRLIREDHDVIAARTADGKDTRIILPLEIKASSAEEARFISMGTECCISFIAKSEGYPLIITEDRWKRQRKMMESRLLAHLELYGQAYARNCEARRIDKAEAKAFLNVNHSYGYAACRYCYGLFLKRHTGHIAEEMKSLGDTQEDNSDRLIAVATFSNARKWIKDGQEIRSYEWTRYASLPDMRVSGGMGKLLKAFIKEVQPDDIMTYADLEWSEGKVYRTLGFKPEPSKDAVYFAVDRETWERHPIRPGKSGQDIIGRSEGVLFFRNFGSRKFRLKLTQYR